MRHALIGSWPMRSSKCMRYFRMLIPAAYPKASPIGFGGGKRTVASGSLCLGLSDICPSRKTDARVTPA